MRNHTATHLLHYALKQVLGEHANQAGSYVGPDRLRLDFTHPKGVSAGNLKKIEDIVNRRVLANEPVTATFMSIDEARKTGATALFGEKYGDIVRVLNVGGYSRELCGGTHCRMTGDIGLFRIISESSVAGGVRRIEAVTGMAALERLREKEGLISDVCKSLNTQEGRLAKKVDELLSEVKSLEKALRRERSAAMHKIAGQSLAGKAEEIGGVSAVISRLDGDMGALRSAADSLRKSRENFGCVLLSGTGNKVSVVCALTEDLVRKGMSAVEIVNKVASVVGGGRRRQG